MATTAPFRLLTLDEFRDLPEYEDGIERLLFRGEVVEEPITIRDKHHARVSCSLSHILGGWLENQDDPIGRAFAGEVGCELPEQNSSFGIDVAIFSHDCLSRQDEESPYIVGPPLLAIEILSPSDSQKDIQRKVDIYLAAGVPLIWVADPHFKTVIVHKPGVTPEMKAGDEILCGGEVLPDFSVPVCKLFG